MNKFLRITAAVALILTSSIATYGQNVVMGDVGFLENNPVDCSTFGIGGNNFFDDGGAANYTANFNDTTVLCPNLTQGTKMTITFAINAGFEFQVDPSDTIYVFDGPDVSSPLLGAHNSGTDPNGFTYTASWDNNPSGCLTLVFVSDGGPSEGTGWIATASCGNQNQPFEPHAVGYVNGETPDAITPVDTGFIDLCLGDSVLLIAQPLFQYSLESTGFGYSQNIDNVIYDWNISDGEAYPNNDSIWFKPLTRSGFLVELKITDAFPQIERIIFKVRVSQLPSFAGTGPLEDSVCLGISTELIGGVTASDTVGVDIPAGTFQLGGSFAGLTFLPDGSGAQYEAPIDIGGFPDGSTINNSQDLNQVCITMEHTYLGDLEIALECPNGTQVTLLNSYPDGDGFIPGGSDGIEINMGDPDPADGTGPGIGWEYCFSSVFNTWGDYPTELAANNTIPTPGAEPGVSLNPNGVFLPEDDFNTFAGCPVNGQWTIIIQDNLGQDDGYIFEWGLFFDPSYFPGSSGYQNTIVSSQWLPDPTIVSGQNDTVLIVLPEVTGNTFYTFEVTDDYGCIYDTTVALFVMPLPSIFTDTIACEFGMLVNGTSSFSGGVWTASSPDVQFSDTLASNPAIFTDQLDGVYIVTFTDNTCNESVSAEIDFPPYPVISLSDTTVCEGVIYSIVAPNDNSYPTTFLWSDGTVGQTLEVSEPGEYTVVLSNVCHSAFASSIIDHQRCDIDAPNVISLAEGSQNPLWYADTEGLKEFSVSITNRWGAMIYQCSESLGNCYWDGRDQKGNIVDSGTYFYIIDAVTQGNKEIQKHGFIQVIK